LKFNVLIYVFYTKNKRSHSRVLNRFINYLSILEGKTLIIVIIDLDVLFLLGSFKNRKVNLYIILSLHFMSLKSIANTFRRKYLKKITEDLGKSSHKNLTPQPQPLVINRILISRPNHRLGNQLLITPLVQEVQQLFPKASIDLFVKGTVAPILFKNYGINEYIKLPRKPLKELTNYFKVWLKIRNKKYDLVINVEQ